MNMHVIDRYCHECSQKENLEACPLHHSWETNFKLTCHRHLHLKLEYQSYVCLIRVQNNKVTCMITSQLRNTADFQQQVGE